MKNCESSHFAVLTRVGTINPENSNKMRKKDEFSVHLFTSRLWKPKENQQKPVETRFPAGFLCSQLASLNFPLVSFGVFWFLFVSFGFLWFLLVFFRFPMAFLWFHLVSIGFHWFPKLSCGFYWFSFGFYWFPTVPTRVGAFRPGSEP